MRRLGPRRGEEGGEDFREGAVRRLWGERMRRLWRENEERGLGGCTEGRGDCEEGRRGNMLWGLARATERG